MKCPFCQTENRDDQERCYHCDKDLSMLRLIVNKAKHHYNQGLEFAERDHLDDAIQELKNTIELDSGMVDAHVVLGTLYAKQERFDEAQATWKQALALNRSIEKAYDYIRKGESAKVAFPAMRRLWHVCLGLGAALLVALITLIFALSPDRDLQAVRQAVVKAKDNPAELTAAFELFDHLIQDDQTSREALDFANTLRDYIVLRWVRQIEIARMAIDFERPGKAIEALEKLKADKPPEQIQLAANEIHMLALQAMYKKLNALADAFYSGDVEFGEFRNEADNYLALSTQADENREQVLTLIDDLGAYHQQTILAEATRAVSEATTTADVLLRVKDWTERYPELGKSLDSQVSEHLQSETEWVEKEVERLVAEEDFETARQQIEGLKVLFRSADRPLPADSLDRMQSMISGARSQSLLEQARQAFRDKAWEAFMVLTDNLEELTIDEVDRTQLTGMRRRAGQSFARERWDWFNKLDPRFESGTISDEDAAEAVRIYERVLDNLPKALNYTRGPVLFYTASAYFKLGQVEKAAQLIAEVRRDYPKSYVMRSVEMFMKTNAEELAPFEPGEEPAAEEEAVTTATVVVEVEEAEEPAPEATAEEVEAVEATEEPAAPAEAEVEPELAPKAEDAATTES